MANSGGWHENQRRRGELGLESPSVGGGGNSSVLVRVRSEVCLGIITEHSPQQNKKQSREGVGWKS